MQTRPPRRHSPTSAAVPRSMTISWRSVLDDKRQLLRHTVATIAYRGGKVLRDAPVDFANFRASEKTRTPSQILAHICDLLDWSCRQVVGDKSWTDVPPQPWSQD